MKRGRPENTADVSSSFLKRKPYPKDSVQRKQHEKELALLIGKNALPFSIVDNKYFRSYIHGKDPRISILIRKMLTKTIIPRFVQECKENHVSPVNEDFETVSLTLDLWMSRGCQDMFDHILHGLDSMFRQRHVHHCLVRCESTSGVSLSTIIYSRLSALKSEESVLSFVKDEGANLTTCSVAVAEVSKCKALGLDFLSTVNVLLIYYPELVMRFKRRLCTKHRPD